MLNNKQVITLLSPWPNSSSPLTKIRHMYICKESHDNTCEFFICTHISPDNLNEIQSGMVDEFPDVTRNPFRRPTRINCRIVHKSTGVDYDASLLTTIRPDICDELYERLLQEYDHSFKLVAVLDTEAILALNPTTTRRI